MVVKLSLVACQKISENELMKKKKSIYTFSIIPWSISAKDITDNPQTQMSF